jgi:hypothetical protein
MDECDQSSEQKQSTDSPGHGWCRLSEASFLAPAEGVTKHRGQHRQTQHNESATGQAGSVPALKPSQISWRGSGSRPRCRCPHRPGRRRRTGGRECRATHRPVATAGCRVSRDHSGKELVSVDDVVRGAPDTEVATRISVLPAGNEFDGEVLLELPRSAAGPAQSAATRPQP